jgi:hypothetical protein
MRLLGVGLILIISLSSCKQAVLEFQRIDIPSQNSSEPSLLKAHDGTIYLNWYEAIGNDITALKFSKLENHTWSVPKTIVTGDNWFVNWADFPALIAFGENLAIHYLEKSGEDTYAYDVKLMISNDKGGSWNPAFKPYLDQTKTEHGFVSKTATTDTEFLAVWLDGRQMELAKKDSTITAQMSLRAAIIDQNNHLKSEYLLDERTCDCCQTDTALTNDGPIVVYRDRSHEDIRDIYYTKLQNNHTWSTPKPIYNDDWKISGCPVNGPAISTKEDLVAVSWFTVAQDTPQIKVAFSNDNGTTFNRPILIGNTMSLGRLDIEMLDEISAVVSWMETVNGQTVIKIQRVFIDGRKSKTFVVAESSESRSSGFPRMIINNNDIIMAWTQVGDQLQVKTAIINSTVFDY